MNILPRVLHNVWVFPCWWLGCCIQLYLSHDTFVVTWCSWSHDDEVSCDVMQQQGYFRSTSKLPRPPSARMPLYLCLSQHLICHELNSHTQTSIHRMYQKPLVHRFATTRETEILPLWIDISRKPTSDFLAEIKSSNSGFVVTGCFGSHGLLSSQGLGVWDFLTSGHSSFSDVWECCV